MQKKRGLFSKGFWFGTGFMFAAYIVMFTMDTLAVLAGQLFILIMRGLGLEPPGFF